MSRSVKGNFSFLNNKSRETKQSELGWRLKSGGRYSWQHSFLFAQVWGKDVNRTLENWSVLLKAAPRGHIRFQFLLDPVFTQPGIARGEIKAVVWFCKNLCLSTCLLPKNPLKVSVG